MWWSWLSCRISISVLTFSCCTNKWEREREKESSCTYMYTEYRMTRWTLHLRPFIKLSCTWWRWWKNALSPQDSLNIAKESAHQFFSCDFTPPPPEQDVHLHADNCGSQNNCNITVGYLLWRVLTGLHKYITLWLPGTRSSLRTGVSASWRGSKTVIHST